MICILHSYAFAGSEGILLLCFSYILFLEIYIYIYIYIFGAGWGGVGVFKFSCWKRREHRYSVVSCTKSGSTSKFVEIMLLDDYFKISL